MYIYFFVEEPSMEIVLNNLLPKIIPDTVQFQFIVFQGKPDMLRKLESRLSAYAKWVPKYYYFVILIDRDNDDCHKLKRDLENICQRSGLTTKTSNGNKGQHFQVLNRIVIEELESWFLGDSEALRICYPKIPKTINKKSKYRYPDNITGGTWENLEKVLQRYGYYPSGLAKLTLATEVSQHMNIDKNNSKSFQVFLSGINSLLNQ